MRHNKNFNHLGRQAGHRKAMLLLGERRLQDQVAQVGAGVDCGDELRAVGGVAREYELPGTAVQAVGHRRHGMPRRQGGHAVVLWTLPDAAAAKIDI